MNHCVPDFEMDEDYSSIIPASSGLARQKKSPMAEDDIMELLWQNGQVVVQSQNQRSVKRSHQIGDAVIPADQSAARENRPEEESATQHFMHEDEMASWLHYPIADDDDSSFDRDLYSDLIYPPPSAPVAPPARAATIPELRISDAPIPEKAPSPAVVSRPPVPPARRTDEESSTRIQNFSLFSRPKGRTEPPGPLTTSNKMARDSTMVDSNETPAAAVRESRVSHDPGRAARDVGGDIGCGTVSGAAAAGTSSAAGGVGRLPGTCELTMTSSPGGSGGSTNLSTEPVNKPPPPPTEDRKRKGREPDDTECQSEDIEFESPDAKKQFRGSTSTKRSRAAEVHNLSERRRRDRINEKMKALQELIPRCNKSDKASMLDEAIEYLKSLQLQVQMMSMGCGMVPMMFPGVQQYMPPMGLGMGMGVGMEMRMSHPLMPFPSVIAGSALPTPAAPAHLGPRFPMPAFHMPPVPLPDPSRIQAPSQSDPMLNSLATQNPNQPRMPNFADPYQQYLGLGLHQTQLPLPQDQAMMQPSSSREVDTRENPRTGVFHSQR